MSASRDQAQRLMVAPLLLAALLPGVAWPQAQGGVEGRVLDAAGRPLAGAEVSVGREGLTAAGRRITDAAGAWRLTRLEPGEYRVAVRRPGYRARAETVRIEPDRMVELLVVLEAAPFSLDSLVVNAPALIISTTDAELGSRLTTGEIMLLPTTVDLRRLIALTPGARPDQIWGGASDQANAYTLDGTGVTHVGQGGALFLPSPTWVETLEVRGLGAGAEVGDLQGGLVEVVTRSGGNTLAGGLRTVFESHRLNGSNLIPREIGSEITSRWEADGQIRGPLIRDRVHFALFGHTIREEQRVLDQLTNGAQTFSAAPMTSRDHRWLMKLNWRPGDRDLLDASLMGRHLSGERTGQTGYEAVEATERHRHRNLTGGLTWQRSWSARSAFTLRVGGYSVRDDRDPYGGPGLPGIELYTATDPPRHQNAVYRTHAEPSNLGVSAMWSVWGRIGGLEHELKVGAERAWGSWTFERQRNGGMSWRPLRVLGFDPATPSTWVFNDAIPTGWGGEVLLDSDVRTSAVFLQDQIRITSWLRFMPGLRFTRWSGDLTPAAGPRFTAVKDEAIAPRVGLVADLDRRGGFVAKLHWGRYHQPMFGGLFDRADGAGVFTDEEIWAWLGPAPESPGTTFTDAERDALAASGDFRLDEVIKLNQSGRVENYRQPYVDQAVVALERAFGSRWKAGIAYVHRRNRNQVALVDRNIESNYTIVEDVQLQTRFGLPVYFGGQPLVLEQVAISNEDIIRVRELVRAGLIFPAPGVLLFPPGMSAAELDALTYEPDLVLTTIPEARRRFEQLQVRLDGRYRTWWTGVSVTVTSLEGNFNTVAGPDDYTAGGPGPWVRLNERFNYYGALANQSRFEGKLHLGGLLPIGFRGGAFFSWVTGDRVSPTMTISGLLSDYAVVVGDPASPDTVTLHGLLFRTTGGHRVFLEPRGSYRFEQRASLDLHLERGLQRGRTEVMLTVDAFNVVGDASVTAIQTAVNTSLGLFGTDYGRVRGRVPPRTLRLGAAVRF